MGREIRRVALDFVWPLDKVWRGYVNPHYRECPEMNRTCFGGQTAAAAWFDSICRFLALLGSEGAENTPGRVAAMRAGGRNFPHPYLTEFPQAPHTSTPAPVLMEAFDLYPDSFHDRVRYTQTHAPMSIVVPDAGVTEMIRALAGFKEEIKPGLFGSEQLRRRLLRLMGAKKDWGACPVCGGDNIDPAIKEAYEAWEREDPPAGLGYQVWETVSEGSPITPVYERPEDLARWCADQRSGWWKDQASTYETWLHFITGPGWAPSMMSSSETGLISGVEAVSGERARAEGRS